VRFQRRRTDSASIGCTAVLGLVLAPSASPSPLIVLALRRFSRRGHQVMAAHRRVLQAGAPRPDGGPPCRTCGILATELGLPQLSNGLISVVGSVFASRLKRRAVRAATGIADHVLGSMLLSAYDGTVVELTGIGAKDTSLARHGHERGVLLRGSRARPTCLIGGGDEPAQITGGQPRRLLRSTVNDPAACGNSLVSLSSRVSRVCDQTIPGLVTRHLGLAAVWPWTDLCSAEPQAAPAWHALLAGVGYVELRRAYYQFRIKTPASALEQLRVLGAELTQPMNARPVS
jgi:hypothetical protein